MRRIVALFTGVLLVSIVGCGRHEPQEIVVELPGGATMEMVWIRPGEFRMGSTESDDMARDPEKPRHPVKITKGFYLGKHELTQNQWESVMRTHPWVGRPYIHEDPECPAAHISWIDLQEFIARLNQVHGAEVYRLPTEAEWEYACRAGTTARWYFGDDESQLTEHAWSRDNAWDAAERYAHPVGLKLPNSWGLYDIHGNVHEWVHDRYNANYYAMSPWKDPAGPPIGPGRIVRGGGLNSHARNLRSAHRHRVPPDLRDGTIGARVVRQGSP